MDKIRTPWWLHPTSKPGVYEYCGVMCHACPEDHVLYEPFHPVVASG